ncbi:SDR family oxidoreductase [Rhodoferax saidenbachensis]|uniref:Saccharopine dehydrogenase n=1 Tax=Rhodoferax saidenbachensis TaxID=1484693 RepID=A0A1P8K8B1_9BURK|nr:SDR family oxidoreductase [Rhodoferax saidenbachensis]APW42234.1 hypothetical protein RS694_06585 [Rhodoferax saidenbachensis]
MKVLVLGGYGIFGARLCEILAADPRVSLVIAGRSLNKAQKLSSTLPQIATVHAIAIDRDSDLHGHFIHIKPDLVIDASGPFQNYGRDPYRVVQACLDCHVNYMDFADGSEFVNSIHQFDQQAKAQGVYVLSGVSSFPVLTAAVVRRITKGWHKVITIRGGIAPSPYAVVGENVIRAIAAYSGQKIPLVRGGVQTHGYALTEIHNYTISPPGRLPLRRTRFSLVDVPDLHVLPQLWPDVHEVWMGAGPVPEVLHRMLNGLAWLVRIGLIPSLRPFSLVFYHAIKILRWGEHRGGMFVEVKGTDSNGKPATRSWHMLAEGNDGPYIPCFALQALVEHALDGQPPKPGARPASGELELEDYERIFTKRTIYTGERQDVTNMEARSPVERVLGPAWQQLPQSVRAAHTNTRSTRALSGLASVERGTGILARITAGIFRFPKASKEVPITVTFDQSSSREIWTRDFGGRKFQSTLSSGSGRNEHLLDERFGPFKFGMALILEKGRLNFVVRNWSFFGLSMPRSWAPFGDSYECEKAEMFHFHVEIRHPLLGLVVRYVGYLAPRIPENS